MYKKVFSKHLVSIMKVCLFPIKLKCVDMNKHRFNIDVGYMCIDLYT